jgi:hypothetical protein
MVASPFDSDHWLLHELTHYNVKINKTTFSKESTETVFAALDTIMELAVTIPQDKTLAFAACSAFVLFLRLIMPLLPPGCNGKARNSSICEEKHDDVGQPSRRTHTRSPRLPSH